MSIVHAPVAGLVMTNPTLENVKSTLATGFHEFRFAVEVMTTLGCWMPMHARTARSTIGTGAPMSTRAAPVSSAHVDPAVIPHSGGAPRFVRRAVSWRPLSAGTGCQSPLTTSATSNVVAPAARAIDATIDPLEMLSPGNGAHGDASDAVSEAVNSSCAVMVPASAPLTFGAPPPKWRSAVAPNEKPDVPNATWMEGTVIAPVPSDGAEISAPTCQAIVPSAARLNIPGRSVFDDGPKSRRPFVTTAAGNDPPRRARPRRARSAHGAEAVLVSSMKPQLNRAVVCCGTTPPRLMPGK